MMSTSMGQVGQPMHPGMQAQQQPPPPQQQQSSQMASQIELKYDNVNKVKSLVWSLKDSFANVMKVAGASINHMAAAGMAPAGKTNETSEEKPPLPRLDKALEDFFSICNQIELHLKAIQECTMQHKDSVQHLPLQITLGKQDTSNASIPDGTLSYSQYLSTVKTQVNFAKSLQEILAEGVRKIDQPLAE